MLDDLLGDVGVSLADVEAFAISIGPGGFTSLRIGLATVKGLAFASDRPVVAVSTLEALALSSLGVATAGAAPAVIVPTLDASRGEVYAAAWEVSVIACGVEGRALLEPDVYTPQRLVAGLPPGARVIGEGAGILASSPVDTTALSLEQEPHSLPDAVAVGRIGARELAAGRGGPAADLLPLYLRRPQAEEERARAARQAVPSRPRGG